MAGGILKNQMRPDKKFKSLAKVPQIKGPVN